MPFKTAKRAARSALGPAPAAIAVEEQNLGGSRVQRGSLRNCRRWALAAVNCATESAIARSCLQATYASS